MALSISEVNNIRNIDTHLTYPVIRDMQRRKFNADQQRRKTNRRIAMVFAVLCILGTAATATITKLANASAKPGPILIKSELIEQGLNIPKPISEKPKGNKHG